MPPFKRAFLLNYTYFEVLQLRYLRITYSTEHSYYFPKTTLTALVPKLLVTLTI